MIEAPPSAKVGSKHRVTWVRVSAHWCRAFPAPTWLPIYGAKHEDAELIGFAEKHWHIDWRFVPKGTLNRVLPERCRYMMPKYLHGRVVGEKHLTGEPCVKLSLMLRAMPHHPFEGDSIHASGHPEWQRKLEDAYEGQKAERHHRCRVCPHRGVKLGSIRDKDGDLVCPSHGLTWSSKDGRLMRRTAPSLPVSQSPTL